MTATPAGGTEKDHLREDVTIDLDAARKARREARGPRTVEIRFGGKTYPLPPELPAEAVHAFGELMGGDVSGLAAGMNALFGGAFEAILDEARAAGDPLSMDDEVFLLEEALKAYGMELPESPASARS